MADVVGLVEAPLPVEPSSGYTVAVAGTPPNRGETP
jgi:hypothetical protein